LDRSMALIRLIFGPLGALGYLVLLVLGAKALMDESHRLFWPRKVCRCARTLLRRQARTPATRCQASL
ncbi:MAG: hypothetical protein EBU07_19250, partial [Betaproteobacteria bacterium]|nr:hypothetical protein [Betaproteobacteria bacterium]